MTEEQGWTTINIDGETARMADLIAAKLGPLVGGKMSRAAAIRRAVRDFYLRECPSETTDDVTESKVAA